MYSAMADLAYEYQDKELQQACRNLWDNMVDVYKRQPVKTLMEKFTDFHRIVTVLHLLAIWIF